MQPLFAQTLSEQQIPQLKKENVDSVFKFEKLIAGQFTMAEVDILDNIYLFTKDKQLKKLKPNGDSAAVFNDVKQYGNPSYIDVSNPLKILVYYKNFTTVVVLDRFLSFRNSINFRNNNIFSVKAITTSYDNNIWIFDDQDFKLKKIADDGSTMSATNDWRQIFDETPIPTKIIDKDNFVYLYDAEKGFYIFDYYGTFKNNLPFLHWQQIAINNKQIIGFVKDTLYTYALQSLNLKSYQLPTFMQGYISIKAINGKLYLLKKEGLYIYSIL
ncbi:hypothetical protein ACFOWM_10160 [Ferruginibacter yonginensis]|uniref:Uncharacterized protein n=1 Tax=Ferruginibacter yonginensis TaxID=1310416 RepID=A0ABV8QTZ5_9BACT